MQSGFWRKFRLLGRWLRRAIIAAAVIIIAALIWFNQIGVPDFLKKPLVGKLHARGIELSFSRLRLRLRGGFIAENVRVGDAKIPNGPTLSLAKLRLGFDFKALLHGQWRIDSATLQQGRLVWPLSPTNSIQLRNIESRLHFGADDDWSLDSFHADFASAKLALSGDISHAKEIRNWKIFEKQPAKKKTGGARWRGQLEAIYNELARSHYARPPELTLIVNGDARNPDSFVVKLAVALGKTQLQLDGAENQISRTYRWRLHGALEPEMLHPFLTATNAIHFLDDFSFKNPLALDGNFYGSDLKHFTATGSAALTNFTIHGVAVDRIAGHFIYTNRVLKFFKPHLARGDGTMTADEIILDFNRKLVWFTNGFSTVDPEMVARAIGKKVGELLEPYVFFQPPTVRVNGRAPLKKIENLHDMDDADLSFEIMNATDFRCLKFHAETVTGTIRWLGQSLILTNMVAQCYGGSGNGSAVFDFSVPHEGADYQFVVNAAKLDLHQIATDWGTSSNRLEGSLSGKVTVTRADTRDWRSVDGFGRARLQNGLLWEIPVFGVLSPVLNALIPGFNIGTIRATDAGGNFTITNGVIYSDSLEIHTAMMRLAYSGKVDLKGKVNADVTAQLLRDAPGIGQIISVIFWPVSELLKFKVSGTLKNPKVEPVHIPKESLMLLHPIRTIQGLLPGESSSTNAPPQK